MKTDNKHKNYTILLICGFFIVLAVFSLTYRIVFFDGKLLSAAESTEEFVEIIDEEVPLGTVTVFPELIIYVSEQTKDSAKVIISSDFSGFDNGMVTDFNFNCILPAECSLLGATANFELEGFSLTDGSHFSASFKSGIGNPVIELSLSRSSASNVYLTAYISSENASGAKTELLIK